MIKTFAAAFLAVAALSPVSAQTARSTPAAAKPAKEKKVCRSDVPTGSMMSKSTCHTKPEWAEIDSTNRYNVEHSRDAAGGAAMQKSD